MRKIIAIVGPTGVGKTKCSIELAKKYNAIIINADSMQIYKNLNIGTAKIKEKEKEGIKHLLFDECDVSDNYTIYNYQSDVRNILDTYDGNIIFVGGSGLYLKAALYDYRFKKEEPTNNNYNNLSNEELYKKVKEKFPNSDVHINNRKRLIRLINKDNSDNYIGKDKLLYDTIFVGLTTSRDTLYKRINQRVDIMIKEGLLQEVKSLYDQNIRSKAIMTGIGYKELYQYFDSKISYEEAIELIKKNSRLYAKRQYTWFLHQMNITWFDVNFDNFDETIKKIVNFID